MIARAREISDDELVRHLGIARHVVREHSRDTRWSGAMKRLGEDEALGIASAALVEARNAYNSSARKGSSFHGFAAFVMRRRLRDALCREYRAPTVLSRADLLEAPAESELEGLLAILTAKERFLLGAFFGYQQEKLTLAEMGRVLALSPSAVRRRIAKALERLRELV